MGQSSLYGVQYHAVGEFLWIPQRCHYTHHTGYYSHYFHNDPKDLKTNNLLPVANYVHYPVPCSPLLYTFRWMYRCLLLLLVLIKLYRLSKLYKITIHMICTITMKQQLIIIYNLIILHWYYTIYWNILGTFWVWLCQLAVSGTCVQKPGFSEHNSHCSWILVAVTDAPQLGYTKHHHSTTRGLKFTKQR